MTDSISPFPKLEFPTRRVTINIVATYEVCNAEEAVRLEAKINGAIIELSKESGEVRLEYTTA